MFFIHDFVFDSNERTIKQAEKSITLNHRTSQLFELLAQHPKETLSRDKIISEVWRRDYVSDHSLTQAISDLRRALGEIHPDYKKLVKTRPKAGYVLDADVQKVPCHTSTNEVAVPPTATVAAKPKTFILYSLLAVLIIAVISTLAASLWVSHTPKTNDVNLYKVAFITFSSPEEYQHLAFGLSDLINYRINQQGHYRSSLIYDDNNDFSNNAALIISGDVFELNGKPVLMFYLDDNINKERIFEHQYPLDGEALTQAAKKILTDIESKMENPFDHAIIAELDKHYPTDSERLNLMYQAHYASNTITPRSLYNAIKLYDEVLRINPSFEIAAAERLIAANMLMELQPNSISMDEYQTMYQAMLDINHPIHPPIYYEALAIRHFSKDNLQITKDYLAKAVAIRESCLSNIIAGKIAEAEGKQFQANIAYRRAFSMKPDDSTKQIIQHLLFETSSQGKQQPNVKEMQG
ncbi:winged helix-turn-helix domain-containing protein [Photobacterium nomapromontoriensis]|uniref:winged helix-turn-helix domain-containing protein n=1 Tax=Photobacterium nomapromontoriensis TaxID=2910237 RepID=UPI003D0AAC5D